LGTAWDRRWLQPGQPQAEEQFQAKVPAPWRGNRHMNAPEQLPVDRSWSPHRSTGRATRRKRDSLHHPDSSSTGDERVCLCWDSPRVGPVPTQERPFVGSIAVAIEDHESNALMGAHRARVAYRHLGHAEVVGSAKMPAVRPVEKVESPPPTPGLSDAD